MTDMRRTLLWVVFTMSLVLLWDGWNRHTGQPSMFGLPPTPGAPTATAAGSAPAGVPGAVPSASSGVPAPAVGAVPAATAAAPGVPALPGTPTGEPVTVSTDLVKATFNTLGGSLERLELLAHKDLIAGSGNVVLFDNSAQRRYMAQTGLVTAQPGITLPTHHTRFVAVPGERSLAADAKTLAIRFESEAIDGRKLAKTYTFTRGDYVVAVKHEFSNEGSTGVTPQLYLQLLRDGEKPAGESSFYFTFTGPAVYTDVAKFQKVEFKDIAKGNAGHAKEANDGWVAMVQHYYASAWLVGAAGKREFRTAAVGPDFTVAMVLPLGEVAPGASAVHEAQLFAGPQEEKKLAALAPGLDLVKDYGWFTVLSKPLFWLLVELHRVLQNWGWSIVGLVVLLKIAFYWLNATAYRSMAKMKAVGPRVTEMRERLKDNPQQMQQEMMRIYKEEKVNPFGGCLPILVQMPFFIALYWVLLSSVEMRNAPWVGWIQDLSAPDPWFILPVLMTASSLFQVWLNPTPPDPMQAKLMWMMPLIFGVMFFFFPAGLVLYWLVNNILSIAQQWWINKQLGALGK
jgi:YidC/Oxa1 family membrane protein insertase